MSGALFCVAGDPEPRGQIFVNNFETVNFIGGILKSFGVEDTTMDLNTQMKKIEKQFLNLKPMREFLREYEKMPVSCIIKLEKEDLKPGEEVEIILSDFKDFKGQGFEYKVDNRILVGAENGEILDFGCAAISKNDPKIKIWGYAQVKDDKVTVKIQGA